MRLAAWITSGWPVQNQVHPLLPQASRNLQLPTNLASKPAPATCLVVKPILNHQALPPTPSKGEARRIAKPPATIDNHRKLPSKLVCTRFFRALRAASRQITPYLASFCVFPNSPASLFPFPCCCASHPHPQLQPRAHPAFPFHLSVASQTCPKRLPSNTPYRRYAVQLFRQRDPALFLCIPRRRHRALIDLSGSTFAQRRHALRPPARRAPPWYLRFYQLHFLVLRSPRRACSNHCHT